MNKNILFLLIFLCMNANLAASRKTSCMELKHLQLRLQHTPKLEQKDIDDFEQFIQSAYKTAKSKAVKNLIMPQVNGIQELKKIWRNHPDEAREKAIKFLEQTQSHLNC